MNTLLQDIRYALRQLRRTPGFALTVVAVMALGIGANVALFTVVRSVLLKPLPFADPSRLMAIYENSSNAFPFNSVAPGMYARWKEQNHSFSSLAMLGQAEFNHSTDGGDLPEMLLGTACTANLLPTMGVEPALGRNFTLDEDRPSGDRVVLLSWSLWERRFAGDPAILGRTIRLNKQPYTVIGVMPRWFAYPDAATQLWTPIYKYFPAERMTAVGMHQFGVVGRLDPGANQAHALADLSATTLRVHNAHLDNPFVSKAANIRPLMEDIVGDVRRPLYVLLAATGCVLLIACLNVANLLVVRAVARRKEMAIRSALGGGRLRLLRERLVESLLLSAAGGAAGLALAFGAVHWLVRTRQDLSRVEAIRIDGEVAAFTVGLIALCALFTGLIASFSGAGGRLFAELQGAQRGSSAGHGRTRLRRWLLAVGVGLTVVLLVASGLLLKSYMRLRSSDLGCTTKNVLTMSLSLFGGSYREPAQQVNFYAALLERVRALPGVEAAGLARTVPGDGYWGDQSFSIVEHAPLPQGVAQFAIDREADPGFFQAIGIPILHGRTFDAGRKLDQANETVISESFARQYFPNEDPLGKHLHYEDKNWEIVGIVGDTRYVLSEDPKPIQYYPLYAGGLNHVMLVIRSSRDVEQYALPVQRIVQEMDHDLPVSDVLTMDQLLGRNTLDESFNTTLLLGFAVLSLALAAAGVFGVVSYTVAQRTNELGIRMALGAQREQILTNVLFDGLRPTLAGLAFGLAASAAVVRLIRSMLFATAPLDPTVFVLVSLGLILVAASASLAPAWRASRIDPMQALRSE
ncbi:MAG: ABC transporter permease [Terracidiphilus sp.]